MDLLVVNCPSSLEAYQDLSTYGFTAIEQPIWGGLIANYVRNKGFSVQILDAEAEGLNAIETAKRIIDINASLTLFCIYGHQPSASTQCVPVNLAVHKMVKDGCGTKTIWIGTHCSALPEETLLESKADFICTGEGPYTVLGVLNALKNNDAQYGKIGGLCYFDDGKPVVTNPCDLISDFDADIPSMPWDLLPMDKYRAHNWHCFDDINHRQPYASLYTSWGCPFKCFEENTIITTGWGEKSKKAKDIIVGDKLLAFDENTGKIKETEVKYIFKNKVNLLLKIKFNDGRTLKVTEEHPFYVNKKWVKAKDLKIGDEIYSINRNDKLNSNPIRRKKVSDRMKLKNPVYNLETRKKISRSVSMHFKNGFKTRFFEDGFHDKYKSFSRVGQSKKREVSEQCSRRMKTDNPMFRAEVSNRVSATQKKKIESGEIIPFMMTAKYWETLKYPKNKCERNVEQILNEHFPGTFLFSGDGSVRVSSYAPDFISENHKKIIEFNGCYWHKCERCFPDLYAEAEKKRTLRGNKISNDDNRKRVFGEHGYKVLEIWQHELKDVDSLVRKIGHFIYNGKQIVSIEKEIGTFNVINFSCLPYENYFANMILSHNCSFCCINAPFGKHTIRYLSPEKVIKEIDILVNKYNVKNIKIPDEMFVLHEHHVIGICDLIIERGYDLNIWAYARVDTSREKLLEKLRKAGVRWLGIGVEAGSANVRKNILKVLGTQESIISVIDRIKNAGIYVGGNYIFGLPLDTLETMQETLDLATYLNAEWSNFYCAFAYPGSALHKQARLEGWPLPEGANGPGWSGYSQHSYDSYPLCTKTLSNVEVLRFRDDAHVKYFSSDRYLNMVESKFGVDTRNHISQMNTIKLKRKLLGD